MNFLRYLSPLRAWACTGLFAGVIFIAVLPHLGVVLVAFSTSWHATVLPAGFTLGNFRMALGHDLTVPAIANSLEYSCLSTFVDVVLGIAIAFVIVRTRIVGRGILDFLVMLPLAVPGLVLAFGYLAMTQNGRLMLRLEALERRLEEQGVLKEGGDLGRPAGSVLNDFALPILGGGTMTLSQWRGRKVALIFMSPRCQHSEALLAPLAAFLAEDRKAAETLIKIANSKKEEYKPQ